MNATERLAREVANCVPGCSTRLFTTRHDGSMQAHVIGWGPSLHRIGMRWTLPAGVEDQSAMADALEPCITLQRRRRETAIAIGLEGCRPVESDVITHMVVDRLVARARHLGSYMVPRIRAWGLAMRSGLERIATASGGAVAEAGALPGDTDTDDPRPRLLEAMLLDVWSFDGMTLYMPGTLPDTVLAALPGRRIGDVASRTPWPGLVDRAIVEAGHLDGMEFTRIDVTPEWTGVPTP